MSNRIGTRNSPLTQVTKLEKEENLVMDQELDKDQSINMFHKLDQVQPIYVDYN